MSVGSNFDREKNVALAQKRLLEHYPDVAFSPVMDTEGLGMKRPCRFFNLMARFSTCSSTHEITTVLKKIEQEAGRTSEEKAQEIIRLDLDLLVCDGEVLKPKDLERDFVRQGIGFLQSADLLEQ